MLTSPPESDPARQSALTYTSAELKILVVEDHGPLLQLLGEILRAAGHFAGLAQSSAEGLGRFGSERWDVVCANRDRLEMNGAAFAREIKRRSPHTSLVMVTERPLLRPGECVDAVLFKPFTCADLGAAISRALKALAGSRSADELDGRIVRALIQKKNGTRCQSLSPKVPLES